MKLQFVLAQNLLRFCHPEVDGADKKLWMDEMERLSIKMKFSVARCKIIHNRNNNSSYLHKLD